MLQFIGKLSNVSEMLDTLSTSQDECKKEKGYLERRLSKLGLFKTTKAPAIRIPIPKRNPSKPFNLVGDFRGLYVRDNL
jgi:hypothetical protein